MTIQKKSGARCHFSGTLALFSPSSKMVKTFTLVTRIYACLFLHQIYLYTCIMKGSQDELFEWMDAKQLSVRVSFIRLPSPCLRNVCNCNNISPAYCCMQISYIFIFIHNFLFPFFFLCHMYILYICFVLNNWARHGKKIFAISLAVCARETHTHTQTHAHIHHFEMAEYEYLIREIFLCFFFLLQFRKFAHSITHFAYAMLMYMPYRWFLLLSLLKKRSHRRQLLCKFLLSFFFLLRCYLLTSSFPECLFRMWANPRMLSFTNMTQLPNFFSISFFLLMTMYSHTF